MGGLSPEYLKNIQKGIGGLGQGALLGLEEKQRRLERRQDYFQSQSKYRDLKQDAVVPSDLQQNADITELFGERMSAGSSQTPIGDQLAQLYQSAGLDVTPDMTIDQVDSLRKQQSAQQSEFLRKSQQEIQIGRQQIDISKFSFDDIQLEIQKDINETKLRGDRKALNLKLRQNKGLSAIIKMERFPSEEWKSFFRGKKRKEIVKNIQSEFPEATHVHVQYFVNHVLSNKKIYGVK